MDVNILHLLFMFYDRQTSCHHVIRDVFPTLVYPPPVTMAHTVQFKLRNYIRQWLNKNHTIIAYLILDTTEDLGYNLRQFKIDLIFYSLQESLFCFSRAFARVVCVCGFVVGSYRQFWFLFVVYKSFFFFLSECPKSLVSESAINIEDTLSSRHNLWDSWHTCGDVGLTVVQHGGLEGWVVLWSFCGLCGGELYWHVCLLLHVSVFLCVCFSGLNTSKKNLTQISLFHCLYNLPTPFNHCRKQLMQ